MAEIRKCVLTFMVLVLVLALEAMILPVEPVAAANLYEFYNSGANVSRPVWGDTWRGQTFTADSNHSITSVKLQIYRQGYPGNVTASIEPVDKNDHPADVDLTSGSVNGDSLSTSAANWCEIILTPSYTLVGGEKYAIVLKAPSGNSTNRVLWRADTEGTYAGGSMEQKVDGDDWVHFGADCMFEVWGEHVTEDLTEVWVDDNWAGSNPGDSVDGHTFGYDAFAAIQDGVNAVAGSTVHVAAGVYNPVSRIRINKDNLVLLGPQADVDPRPSQGSSRTAGSAGEAIIDGSVHNLNNIVLIDADNVTVNGFEVKSGTGDLVYQENVHSGTIVKHCIVHDGNGDDGVQLKNCTNAILEYDYVCDIAFPGDALSIADNSTNGKIRHNEAYNISSANAAIYVYGSEYTEITSNLIYGVTQNSGIRLGNKHGTDAGGTGGLIKDNIIYDVASDGINISTSHVIIEGNDVYHCGSEDGAISVNYTVTDITIRENSVHDNVLSTAKRLTSAGILIESGVDAANVAINFNNIYSNDPFGVTNESSGLLDATNNWWGANDGPNASPGSGDNVSANVTYDPWLVLGVIADPNTILVGGGDTSAITADMTKNSDGDDTSAQGHIPDGTQIVFTTDKGSIGSTSITKNTTDGKATATLTSGDSVGTATVCAKAPGHPVQSKVCTGVEVYSVPVGGEARPVNKLAILAPWIALLTLLIGGTAYLALRRRKVAS
jgi:hypothetical protein